MRARDVIQGCACALLLAACDPPAPGSSSTGDAPGEPAGGTFAARVQAQDAMVPEVAIKALASLFAPADGELHYFARAVDLNDDGHDEVVVEVIGPAVCTDEGCSVFVLSPDPTGLYKVVAQIGPAGAPLYAARSRSNGWRDLLVGIKPAGLARLAYDGRRYPENPARVPVLPQAPADAELLLPVPAPADQPAPLPVPVPP